MEAVVTVPALLAAALRSAEDNAVAADALEAAGHIVSAQWVRKALTSATPERCVSMAKTHYDTDLFFRANPQPALLHQPAIPPAGMSPKTAAAITHVSRTSRSARSRSFAKRYC